MFVLFRRKKNHIFILLKSLEEQKHLLTQMLSSKDKQTNVESFVVCSCCNSNQQPWKKIQQSEGYVCRIKTLLKWINKNEKKKGYIKAFCRTKHWNTEQSNNKYENIKKKCKTQFTHNIWIKLRLDDTTINDNHWDVEKSCSNVRLFVCLSFDCICCCWLLFVFDKRRLEMEILNWLV